MHTLDVHIPDCVVHPRPVGKEHKFLTARYGLGLDDVVDQRGEAKIDVNQGAVELTVKLPCGKGTLACVEIPPDVLRMALAVSEQQFRDMNGA